MSVYLCKWPNGDISIAAASNSSDLYWLLDEVGDANDGARLIRLKHPVAVHFRLVDKSDIDPAAGPLQFLEFEEFGEQTERSVVNQYPALDAMMEQGEPPPREQVEQALSQERGESFRKAS
jgi:hypothetical protein